MDLIGKKIIGFRFNHSEIDFANEMEYIIGKEGTIKAEINQKYVDIYFPETNSTWLFPYEEVLKRLDLGEGKILTREQVKEIYDIACPEWQNIISNYISNHSSIFSRKIYFDEDMISKMFSAATGSQLPILEKLFDIPFIFNPGYVYIFKGIATYYKLHRMDNDKYAWINLFDSNSYANGTFTNAPSAIKQITKNKSYELITLKTKEQVINFYKSL